MEERKKRGDGLRLIYGKEQTANELKVSAALDSVANRIGGGSIQAVAIAYVMAKAPRVFPVVGGKRIDQLHNNIKALDIRLTKDQIKELEEATTFDIGSLLDFIGGDLKVEGGKGGAVLALSANVDWVQAEKPVGYA